jgi:hypothetical protein
VGINVDMTLKMTKYAVDTTTAYSILTLALSYTYEDYTTAPLPYRISYIYTYYSTKDVKTTDRSVSGMCQFPSFERWSKSSRCNAPSMGRGDFRRLCFWSL